MWSAAREKEDAFRHVFFYTVARYKDDTTACEEIHNIFSIVFLLNVN